MDNLDMEELLDVEPTSENPAPEAPQEPLREDPLPEAEPAPQEDAAPQRAEEPQPVKEKEPKPKKEPKPRKEREKAPQGGMAGGFLLADGEEVCDTYSFISGGKVYMTNRRLLFDTYTRADLPIDRVQGISAVKASDIRWGKLIFGAVFLALCAACIVLFVKPDLIPPYQALLESYDWINWIALGLGIVFGIIALAMLCKCGRMRFVVNIITDSLEQAVSIRNQGASRGDQFNTVIWAMPGKKRELDRFVQQFGARLIEIKDQKR